MPNVVDALVVTLGLDASTFTREQREMVKNLQSMESASIHTAKGMEAAGQQAAAMFSRIKTEALSLLGIFLGGKGIESYIRDTTRDLADMGRAARNIDISPSDLNAFTAAIERMGGSAASAVGSLEGIAKAKQQWQTFGDNPQFIATLGMIGATPNMAPLQIMNRFSEFAKSNQNQPGGVQRVQQAGELLGVDRTVINSILQMTRSSTLGAEMERSRELMPLTKEMVDHLTSLQTAIITLEQSMDGLSRTLLDKIAPGLTSVATQLALEIAHLPATIEDIKKAINAQREFDQQHMPPATGANEWMNNLIEKGTGIPTGAGSWYEWLMGNDMGADRAHSRSGAPPMIGRGGPRVGAYSPTTPERDKAASDSLSFWIGKGLTPTQASGMVAQEMAESGGNPAARGDYVDAQGRPIDRSSPGATATAHGAYQWHRDRRARILAGSGIDVSTADIQHQREAAYWEFMNVEHEARRRVLNAKTPEEAGAGATEFERPDPNRRAIIDAERGRDAAAILRRQAPSGIPALGPRFGPQLTPGDRPALSGEGPAFKKDPTSFDMPDRALPGPRAANEDNSTTVTIGTVNVHTQATDAKGIAKDLHGEIAAQANRGLN